MRSPNELRSLVEEYVGDLALTPELHGQADAVRYALVGGKRVRGVICLATAEAAGSEAERALPAGASLELVHAFSLVHDDLPALDNDAERRGRPSAWAEFGVAEVPEREQAAWRAFGDELGLLFQIVDDFLDGDGYVLTQGADRARALADQAAERARTRLAEVPADTSVLEDIVDGLATRTS